jgi:signal transduction histidine kinase
VKTILILEDDSNILSNLTELLEAEGYKTFTGTDGSDGIALLKNMKPDLIICDIMMPRMNGHEFYKLIRKDYETRFIPFIFLTAKTDLTSIREGLNLGVDDYVTKPFSSEDLLSTIETRLKKQKEFNSQLESFVKNVDMYIPHELRTPLVSIIGYSQLMLSELDSIEKKEVKDMTEKILWSAQRLHERIEKFISYAEMNLYKEVVSREELHKSCEINGEYIHGIISSHYYIADRVQDYKINIQPALLNINENHLKKVLRELLENSAKYSKPGSAIKVEGIAENENYLISILDLGIGISADEMNNIGVFQQFSREEHSQQGNGIGLALVKRIVQHYNGTFKLESEKGKFTKAIINLPVSS